MSQCEYQPEFAEGFAIQVLLNRWVIFDVNMFWNKRLLQSKIWYRNSTPTAVSHLKMHPRMLIAWLADGLNLVSGN